MLVTDEMVETALGILFPLNAAFNEGAHERLKAKIRSALESALSHAAGQEVAAWCATDETGTIVEALGMNQSRRFDTPLYLAPPTTSTEVGQDGEQCRAASWKPVAWIRPDGVTTSDAGLMRHWEAQGLQFEPLIRALSRGVPEGE